MIAGWSSQVAHRAHNPKVEGSNPSPATILSVAIATVTAFWVFEKFSHIISLTQRLTQASKIFYFESGPTLRLFNL